MIKRYLFSGNLSNCENEIRTCDIREYVKYKDHLSEIDKIKQAINNYLKECINERLQLYHNEYDDDKFIINRTEIRCINKILRIIEGVE